MIRFPTNLLVCEGPDCVGKTSLYNATHKVSRFSWNIQDRSWLSMLVYGRLYGRDTNQLSRGLWEELTCLNNRVILVLPTWDIVAERFKSRGDDFQDIISLKKLHEIFDEYREQLEFLPNVKVIDNSELSIEDSADVVSGWVRSKEIYGLDEIAAEVLRFVSNVPGTMTPKDCEATLDFTFYDDVVFTEREECDDGEWSHTIPYLEEQEDEDEILSDPDEGEYYTKILTEFLTKIRGEFCGINEYKEKQTSASRRFVYTDDTCISFIQAMHRGNTLDFHTVLRSSNVAKTFIKDLRFIHYLASRVVECRPEFRSIKEVRFRFNINSAHLVR